MSAGTHSERHAVRHQIGVTRQWLIVVGLGLFSLGLGIAGFIHAPGEEGHPRDFLDALYSSLQLFHMHFAPVRLPLPWELQVARFLSPFVLVITLFKGFLFVARSHHHAFLHRSKRDHVVICGLGQKGLQLARECRKKGQWVVVIEKDPKNELLSVCDDEGIFYSIGDATESTVLNHARVIHAKEIIVVTADDETNVRIAMEILRLKLPDKSRCPKCFVHLEDIDLRERLQRLFQSDEGHNSQCTVHLFDVYDAEARRVLVELPLDGAGIGRDDSRSVHVVICGFGRMGRSLALRAAKIGHFANGRKLRISVIDRHAEQHHEHLLFHYPSLENNAICQINFFQADARSLTARKLIEGWAAEAQTLLHIFVCIDDNTHAVEVALRLQETLVRRADCNLCVRIKSSESLANVLELAPKNGGPRISAFGMVEDCCRDDAFRHEYNEEIAKASHEEFVRQRLADSRRTEENDLALRPWGRLRDDFRESSRQQADHIGIKLRAIGCEATQMPDRREAIIKFDSNEIELLAEVEHRRWNAERWLAGWRYGTPSDKARRINENLISWAELDDSIRKYDREAVDGIIGRLKLTNPPLKVVRKNGSAATS